MHTTQNPNVKFNLDSFQTTNITATCTISATGGYGTIDGGKF